MAMKRACDLFCGSLNFFNAQDSVVTSFVCSEKFQKHLSQTPVLFCSLNFTESGLSLAVLFRESKRLL